MHPTISDFILRILFFMAVAFGLHFLFLNYLELPLFAHKIIANYIVNLVFGIAIFSILFSIRKKIKNQIGFIFILGGMLKFFLFFAFFYKDYMEDKTLSKIEFFTLFIPYILALVIEVFSLSKWLNKLQ
tara:strand:+ start:551 stop:937 length:387 start_codon:yes stop_codon:yes gene_type:complete